MDFNTEMKSSYLRISFSFASISSKVHKYKKKRRCGMIANETTLHKGTKVQILTTIVTVRHSMMSNAHTA